MDNHFFAYMYRLRYIKRWSLMRNVVRENVAEHSFHVAMLTHVLCTIANEVFGRDIDTEKAVSMALFHDATEVFTGDIPTPVKHQNEEILSSFRGIERLAAGRLLDMIPDKLRPVYRELLGINESDGAGDATRMEDAGSGDAASGPIGAAPGPAAEIRRILKAADLLDSYIKCVTELSAGNHEFAVAKKQIGQALVETDLPEVDYFLEHLAPSLEKTLDELTEN